MALRLNRARSGIQNAVEMGGCKGGRSIKASSNERRSSSTGPAQRSRSLSPTAGHNTVSSATTSMRHVGRVSVIGCDRGRPPRPTASARRSAAVVGCAERSDRVLTPMGQRNRSSSLPSTRQDGMFQPRPGRLQSSAPLTDGQRGAHLDGSRPIAGLYKCIATGMPTREDALVKARQAAQSRVDSYIRRTMQEEACKKLHDPELQEAQASARKLLYDRRRRQRAVAHAINKLLQMSEDAKSTEETGSSWNEAVHANRAV